MIPAGSLTSRIVSKVVSGTVKTYHTLKDPAICHNVSQKIYLRSYIYFFSFMLLLAFILFALVKTRLESFELGYRIAQQQKEQQELQQELRELLAELTYLRSNEHLLQMNQKMQLQLLPARQWMQPTGTKRRARRKPPRRR